MWKVRDFNLVLTIRQLLDYWESTGKVEKDKIEAAREFLEKIG